MARKKQVPVKYVRREWTRQMTLIMDMIETLGVDFEYIDGKSKDGLPIAGIGFVGAEWIDYKGHKVLAERE